MSHEIAWEGGGGAPNVTLAWQARRQLVWLGMLALLPAIVIWGSALVRSVGFTAPMSLIETLLPAPNADLPLRIAVGWTLTLLLPALAASLTFLGAVDLEVRMSPHEVHGLVRWNQL